MSFHVEYIGDGRFEIRESGKRCYYIFAFGKLECHTNGRVRETKKGGKRYRQIGKALNAFTYSQISEALEKGQIK